MRPEIGDPEGYRAALYVRLSKEDEKEGPSESVSNQISLLEEFAQGNRLEVYDLYIDDGWSGANFDRPGFRRMIADIEAKRVNLVVTKDLSRLGRDYILTGHYLERYFPEHRVRYVSLLDGIDTGVDSTANDITPFRAIMNDLYAKDISKKIRSVKRDKQRRGLFIGGKPVYGYRMHPTEKNRIVVDEGAAPVVRRVFDMALEGTSCRQIAARLNAEGVPSPAAYAGLSVARPGPHTGQWSGERISDMLQNETYLGNMVQGRRRKISYKTKKCQKQDPKDWIVVEGTHEPLVDRETFDRVRRMIASRKHTRSRTYDFPLKGLIFCHECGHPLAVLNRKNARGEDVLYFVCRTYQRFTGAGVCTSHTIQERAVTRAVVEQMRTVCERYLRADELLPLARREIAKPPAERSGGREIAGLQAKIDSLTRRLDKVYLDRLNGVLDDGDFERVYGKLKEERAVLEQRAEQSGAPGRSPAEQADLARALVGRFLDTADVNRELLVSLIERVELTAEKRVLLRFRFPEPGPPGQRRRKGRDLSRQVSRPFCGTMEKTEGCPMERSRAAIYCRVDGGGDPEARRELLALQRRALERHAAAQGMQIAACYEDDGLPGCAPDRPGLARLMEDYDAGKFDQVLVVNRGRLYRGSRRGEPEWPFPIRSLNRLEQPAKKENR